MTKEEFIWFLDENTIRYNDESTENYECVRVLGDPVNIVTFRGEKKKYTPYLRVSCFEGDINCRDGQLYTRDNGWCDYKTDEWVKTRCLELRDE